MNSYQFKMIVIVMGVSGSGKSTIGSLLASTVGWQFFDADRFHPGSNIAKMTSGAPLNDADRKPWLEAMREAIAGCLAEGENAVFACSALKESYRSLLCVSADAVRFVYLKGSFALIEGRISQRENHFMKTDLLESQFDALEEPADVLAVDVSQTPDRVVEAIRLGLGI